MKKIIIVIVAVLTLTGCKQVAKNTIKKGTKTATKEVVEESVEKGVKMGVRKTAQLTIEELPKGRKTLSIVQAKDGRLIPEINNLNEHAVKFSNAVNEALLKTRRAAIAPFDQFPTMAQLKAYNPKKLIISETPSADILRKNMYLAMDPKSVNISKGFGGTAAHHVIEGSDKAAEQSRAILKKFGININAPENGILLPDSKSSIYKGCRHQTSHTEDYSKYVYNKIKDSKTKDDLIASLMEIKHELYSGKLNLQGPAQQINKNFH